MKAINFWKTLVLSAAMLTAGVGFTSCDKNETGDFEAEIRTDQVSQKVEPGQAITIKVTSNTNWTASVTDTKGILTLSKTSGKKGDTSVVATISDDAESHSTATVTFTAMGKVFGVEWPATASITFTVGGSAAGTLEDPLSCADAIAKAQEAGSDKDNAAGPFYIKGVITKVSTTFQASGSYGNANFYMKDDPNDANDFYAFQVYYLGNRKWESGDTEVQVGDEVIIYGKVYTYVGTSGNPTPETTGSGSAYIYSLNGVTDGGSGSGGGGTTTPPDGDDANRISTAAGVKAGTYYMAGYIESYTNTNNGVTTTTNYAPYSYHLWTGTLSSTNGNADLNTVNYEYNKDAKTLTLNPNLSAQDAAKGTAVKVEIESANKANTWYIKYNGQYLYSTANATNRRMALGSTPTEWVFSDNAKGGINLESNDVILGTAGATYDLLRSYKTPANSLVYGVCFFTTDVTVNNEGGGGDGGNQGGGTTDPNPNPGGKGGVDILNNAFTGVGSVSTYTDWSGKVGTSGAVYAGRSAGTQGSIQLRVTNSNEGVVTTASGGKVTKIQVKWHSQTTSARTLDVYAKNTAYSTAADLFKADTQGTKVASFASGDGTKEITITGDYTYIGFRSNASALYLDEVQITWVAE